MDESHQVYEFDAFRLDQDRCELTRLGRPVPIHPTPLRLLSYLIEHRDRTVSKQDLLKQVWSDSFVSDNALSSAICELRHALSDDGISQQCIRTERGRGYRFIAEVSRVTTHEPPSLLATIAVLPFLDLSAAGDMGYLADGLTEELIHVLCTMDGLHVVSRTSAFAFKKRSGDVREFASELHAGILVEGSIRTAKERARVTAQLVRATDGYHMKSRTYDHHLDDVLELEENVALLIAGDVQSAVKSLASSKDP